MSKFLITVLMLILSVLVLPTVQANPVFQPVYLQSVEAMSLSNKIRKWTPEADVKEPDEAFQAVQAGLFSPNWELNVKVDQGAWFAFSYYVEQVMPLDQLLLRMGGGSHYEADIYVYQKALVQHSKIPDFDNANWMVMPGGGNALKLPAKKGEQYWVLIKPNVKYPVTFNASLVSEPVFYQNIINKQIPVLLSCGAVAVLMLFMLLWQWQKSRGRVLYLLLAGVTLVSHLLHFGYFFSISKAWWSHWGEIYTVLFVVQQIIFLSLIYILVDIRKESPVLKAIAWSLPTSLIITLLVSMLGIVDENVLFALFRFIILGIVVLQFVLVIRALLVGNPLAAYLILAAIFSFSITCFQIWKYINIIESEVVFLILRDSAFVFMMITLALAIFRQDALRKKKKNSTKGWDVKDLSHVWVSDVYTLSQELRTPATGIVGMAQLLQRSDLDSSQRHYANVILSSTKEIVDTLSAVQDIARINAKSFQFDSVSFSVEQLFQFVADFFEFDLVGVESQLDAKFSDAMPIFYIGDQVRIQEMLAIAMRVLLRFSKEKLEVDISAKDSLVDDRVMLQFKLRAKDLRLSKEGKGRFVDIVQGDEDALRLFGGARGAAELGLVLIKKIINEMGGKLTIDVASDRSVSLSFSLPLLVDKARQVQFDRDHQLLQHKKVAVIYTSSMFAEHVVRHLKSWGVDAEMIDDTGEWRQFNVKAYDLLVLSNSSRWPVAKLLKQCEDNSVPVLFADAVGGDASMVYDTSAMRIAHMSVGSTLSDMTAAMLELLSSDTDDSVVQSQNNNVFAPYKVLLAEDNRVNQQVVMAMLNNLGVEADCVNDGSEVLPLIFDHPEKYDLILLDYDMPQMSGIETARALRMRRRNSAFKPLKMCCLTAHATLEVREQCIAAGMDAVLVKPLTLSTLEEYLVSVFKRIEEEKMETI